MPFKKTGKGTYTSPSGRVWTAKQVAAYYATEGFTRPPKTGAKPAKAKR